MADNRMYLRCRVCGAEFRLATYSQGGPWDARVFTTRELNEWFAEHGMIRIGERGITSSEHEGRDDDWTRVHDSSGEWYEIGYE